MPVTKTAKRALRGSERKSKVNRILTTRLEIAIRLAKKGKKQKDIISAISLADKSVKNRIIHKNKAAHIKSTLSKLSSGVPSKTTSKKSSKSLKKQKK